MMQNSLTSLGVGLGLRRDFTKELLVQKPKEISWLEIHPENYIDRGGPIVHELKQAAEIYPIRPHGLTVSVGNREPLDWIYLKKLKTFLREYNMTWYSDHLCFSQTRGHFFHDLIPVPFTRDVLQYVAERARLIQDFLEVPFGVENTSFYVHPEKPEMTELEFFQEFLETSGAFLMCDVNNLYVNQLNHGSDAREFVEKIDTDKIIQIHVAGHDPRYEDLVIDHHGAAVCEEVWELLRVLGCRAPLASVLIERDSHIPPLDDLLLEVKIAKQIYDESWKEVKRPTQFVERVASL